MQTKFCRKCNSDVPVENFHKATKEKDGLYCWCKPCRRAYDISKEATRLPYHRARYHNNKDEYLDNFYKRRYKITLADYNRMLQEQNNACAVCKQSCVSGRRLSVDHSHTTGNVRGLLCGNCNKSLGCAKDSIDILNGLIEYLKKSEVNDGEFDESFVSLNYLKKKYDSKK